MANQPTTQPPVKRITPLPAKDPGLLVHTPAESTNVALSAAEKIRGSNLRGLEFFIPEIGTYISPLLPGQTAILLAQTSNFKSGSLDAWTTAAAKQLVKEDRADEAIVFISAEETVEEQMYRQLARATGEDTYAISTGAVHDWNGVRVAAAKLGAVPIYRIAESLERESDQDGRIPELTFSNVARALELLRRGNVTGTPVRFAAIFIDYLQAFPFDPEIKRAPGSEQRRLQVATDFERMFQAARYFQAPVVVAAQAKTDLTHSPKDFPLPGVWDIHETTDPARRAARIITQWMPKTTHTVGQLVDHNGLSFTVAEDMLWIRAAKQRGGLPAGRTWLTQIDYKTYDVRLHPLMQKWSGQNRLDAVTETYNPEEDF